MPPAPLHILILAAGASRRMGPRDKLLETVGGLPLLAHLARQAAETGLPVTVVLPTDRPLRQAAISGLPVHRVEAMAAREGMAHSLHAGLASLPAESDVLLLLADLPEITTADLDRMRAAHPRHPGRILQATTETGTPGHPVLFPAGLRPELMALSGDQGARAVLRANSALILPVPLPGRRAVTDLDTPEDWAAWRSGNSA